MVGHAKGVMVSTHDLCVDDTIEMDHEEYTVVGFWSKTSVEATVVVLASDCGYQEIEVTTTSLDEPIWERV